MRTQTKNGPKSCPKPGQRNQSKLDRCNKTNRRESWCDNDEGGSFAISSRTFRSTSARKRLQVLFKAQCFLRYCMWGSLFLLIFFCHKSTINVGHLVNNIRRLCRVLSLSLVVKLNKKAATCLLVALDFNDYKGSGR